MLNDNYQLPQLYISHGFIGYFNRLYKSFLIKIHSVNANHHVIGICFSEWPAVINDLALAINYVFKVLQFNGNVGEKIIAIPIFVANIHGKLVSKNLSSY